MQIKKQQQTIIMITIVVIVMIGFALFVKESIYRHKEVRKNGYPINQREQDQTPELVTTNLDTSDWKTYVNKDYGFEVKYPKGYDVRDREYTGGNPNILRIVYFKTDTSSMNDFGISVVVGKIPAEGLGYDQIIKNETNNNPDIKSYIKLTVNDKSVVQLKYNNNPDRETYFEAKDIYYKIGFISAGIIDPNIYNGFLLSFRELN